jgi:hypothetical protein
LGEGVDAGEEESDEADDVSNASSSEISIVTEAAE